MQCGIGRLTEQRIARRLDRPHQPTFSHEGCDGAGGFADNSIMAQSSPKNPTVTFHAIELDDFDSSYLRIAIVRVGPPVRVRIGPVSICTNPSRP
jgi:hypothetical protein